ncbi:MAG: tRNA 5-methoxyuridine(34)/uridine 5-oxyacetic acid(34) synthase CmoB [Cardiobacteriaceae bacterium]|nr:tRNA 5-methoxyuridine(34)/uridine 5-oxyacetic acid(34) synthase CmoB [Cardiobacteriaceae bacterium]
MTELKAVLAAEVDRFYRYFPRLNKQIEMSIFIQRMEEIFANRHGKTDEWWKKISELVSIDKADLNITYGDEIKLENAENQATKIDKKNILELAQLLIPWRKGRFNLCGIDVNSEWRSELKMQRLLSMNIDFSGKKVVDVGTGNGYFLYRFLGKMAEVAVGIEPSWHYFMQYLFLQKLIQDERAVFLPLTLDNIPEFKENADIVLAMGVLYHRRDPIFFISQLKEVLNKGGILVLETLVIDGDENCVYTPKDRYCGMTNVWFVPSVQAVCRWLKRLKLQVLEVSEPVLTTSEEQRRTEFSPSYSLQEFLENFPQEEDKYPPKRAIILARKM